MFLDVRNAIAIKFRPSHVLNFGLLERCEQRIADPRRTVVR